MARQPQQRHRWLRCALAVGAADPLPLRDAAGPAGLPPRARARTRQRRQDRLRRSLRRPLLLAVDVEDLRARRHRHRLHRHLRHALRGRDRGGAEMAGDRPPHRPLHDLLDLAAGPHLRLAPARPAAGRDLLVPPHARTAEQAAGNLPDQHRVLPGDGPRDDALRGAAGPRRDAPTGPDADPRRPCAWCQSAADPLEGPDPCVARRDRRRRRPRLRHVARLLRHPDPARRPDQAAGRLDDRPRLQRPRRRADRGRDEPRAPRRRRGRLPDRRQGLPSQRDLGGDAL